MRNVDESLVEEEAKLRFLQELLPLALLRVGTIGEDKPLNLLDALLILQEVREL